VQRAMRTQGVVIDAPRFDQRAGFGDARKPVLVQAFVAKLPVEAFNKGVLDRLARSDEAQLHAADVGPGVEGAAAEFRAVVHHQNLGQPDRFGETLEDADDAQARQRSIDFDGDTFAREVVDDVQGAETAPIGERIDHEIHRPALAAAARSWQRNALATPGPRWATPSHLYT